ncbi:MAG: UvrD-helicase domain-containing protein [Porphyromonadaceae bacterium]|nr:MAG: UvrD-helicase domain-containing protein [Porphyromonadaceae bacterium]
MEFTNLVLTCKSYGKKVVEYRIQKGYLTSSDVIYMALDILDKCPIISELIIKRYPYIIVDEAQDTSEDQHKLIEKLCKAGLKKPRVNR